MHCIHVLDIIVAPLHYFASQDIKKMNGNKIFVGLIILICLSSLFLSIALPNRETVTDLRVAVRGTVTQRGCTGGIIC